jgi:hypothetical protein
MLAHHQPWDGFDHATESPQGLGWSPGTPQFLAETIQAS